MEVCYTHDPAMALVGWVLLALFVFLAGIAVTAALTGRPSRGN